MLGPTVLKSKEVRKCPSFPEDDLTASWFSICNYLTKVSTLQEKGIVHVKGNDQVNPAMCLTLDQLL